MAWLACRVIAERLGEPALLSVYRAVRAGSSPDEALGEVGLGLSTLSREWGRRLRTLVVQREMR